MALDLRDYWQRIMYAGCYERREGWLIERLLRRGDTFIDGGAHIGYHACRAASVVASGHVFAFEPNPDTAVSLRAQVDINPHLPLSVEPMALGEVSGSVAFSKAPPVDHGWMIGMSCVGVVPGWTPCQVPATTLDQFVDSRGIRRIQLCKMDLEGSEAAALRGARRSLESGLLESLIVEVNNRTRDNIDAETQKYPFDFLVQFTPFWRLLKRIRDVQPMASWGKTDVLLARGSCASRWRSIGWRRWLV